MSAQIIPFQTKTHRTLVLARAWYYHLKEDYSKQGLIVAREQVIRNAVIEAKLEETLGFRYWENSENESAIADEWRKIFRRDNYRTEWLQCWLDRYLHSKFLRVRNVPPRRPRCRKPRNDAPVAQVIPLPNRRAEKALEAAAK